MTKITGSDPVFRQALSRSNRLTEELKKSLRAGDVERAIGLKHQLQAVNAVFTANQKEHLLFENKLLQEMR